MSLLYLLGGRQRKLLFKSEDEQRLYEAAIILRVDTSAGIASVELEYKTPPVARASDESSHCFKSATLVGNKFYTYTSTEVLILKCQSSNASRTYRSLALMIFTTSARPLRVTFW